MPDAAPASLRAADGAPATLVPLGVVAGPMALGLLAELVGWAILALHAPLLAGWYGWPALLVAVHLVAVGGLLLPVLGAGWQLVPVVLAAPLPAAVLRAAKFAGVSATVGALLLWAGLGGALRVGAMGAALVVGALLVRSVAVVSLLAGRPGASGRLGIRAWLLGAEASLWAGLGYAVALYAGKLGHPVLADPIAGIGHHAALLGLGWVGGWEVGLGALLLPMFALGREPRPGPLLVAAALWFGGLAISAPRVWAVGALLAVALLLRSLASAGRSVLAVGPGLAQAGLALSGLAATALAAATDAVAPHVLVAAAFALWLVPLQHGVAARIVPFLLWAHVLAPVMAPGRAAVAPTSLVDSRVAWAQAAATALGGIVLVGGLAAGLEGLAHTGAAGLLVGAALHAATLLGVATRTFLTWRAAVALPGTTSEASCVGWTP